MKSNFNKIDLWMLKKWSDIERFNNARTTFIDKFDKWVENTINEGKNEYLEEYEKDFLDKTNKSKETNKIKELHFYKKHWIIDEKNNWNKYSLMIADWNYESLSGENEEKFYYGVWTKHIIKYGIELGKFNEQLKENIKKILPDVEFEELDDGIYCFVNFPLHKIAENVENQNESEISNIIITAMKNLKEIGDVLEETRESYPEFK